MSTVLVVALSPTSLGQDEQTTHKGGTHSSYTGPRGSTYVFIKAVLLETDLEGNSVIFTDHETGKDMRVILDKNVKIKTEDTSGGQELLSSLQRGMHLRIKFHSPSGLAKKIKVVEAPEPQP
jgi:hypothetical protein